MYVTRSQFPPRTALLIIIIIIIIIIIVKLKVPLQVPLKVKVKVRTWSGHGQVRSGQTLTPTLTQMWDLSYTLKLVSTHHHHHHPPASLNECLVIFLTLCDTL